MDGIPFYLAWEKKEQTEIVIDRHNRLLLLKSTEEKKKDFQIIITQWAIHSFFSTIRSILNSYKKTLGIQPQKVFVRPTRSQWGSMSKNRNMSLSWSLFAFEEKSSAISFSMNWHIFHFRITLNSFGILFKKRCQIIGR